MNDDINEPQDYDDYPDTLRKVTAYLLDVDEKGVNFGRIVRETGCKPDLVAAAISWLEISDGKSGLPVLIALHTAPERYTFRDRRCRSIPREEWPADSKPAKHRAFDAAAWPTHYL